MPTIITDEIMESGGDYGTIAAWESDTTGNLVTADEVRIGRLHKRASTNWDERTLLTGSTTDTTRYRVLTVAEADRHTGIEGTGTIIEPSTEGWLLRVNESNVRLEWLSMAKWKGDSAECILLDSGVNFRGSYLLAIGDEEATNPDLDGVRMQVNNRGTTILENSAFANCNAAGFTNFAKTGNTIIIHNSSFVNCNKDGVSGDFPVVGFNGSDNTGSTIDCVNVYAHCITENASHSAFNGVEANGGTITCTNCVCSDDSITGGFGVTDGGNNVENKAPADQFVDLTNDVLDLHLKATSDLIAVGVDLSADSDAPITDDIDGDARDASTPDVGWDEFVAPVVAADGGSGPMSSGPRTINTAPTGLQVKGMAPDAMKNVKFVDSFKAPMKDP